MGVEFDVTVCILAVTTKMERKNDFSVSKDLILSGFP